MSGPILAKTAALPANSVLQAKQAHIEHHLYGNEGQARRVAEAFERRGWSTKAEPQNEFGWAAVIIEDPARFKPHSAERVRQLCAVAELHHLKYRAWWIFADDLTDYVSQ